MKTFCCYCSIVSSTRYLFLSLTCNLLARCPLPLKPLLHSALSKARRGGRRNFFLSWFCLHSVRAELSSALPETSKFNYSPITCWCLHQTHRAEQDCSGSRNEVKSFATWKSKGFSRESECWLLSKASVYYKSSDQRLKKFVLRKNAVFFHDNKDYPQIFWYDMYFLSTRKFWNPDATKSQMTHPVLLSIS